MTQHRFRHRAHRALRVSGIAALLVAAALLPPRAARAQRFVASADTCCPRIRFADSLTSAHDRCLVTQKKLNLKLQPVYVNGVPMGFC